MLRFLTAGESHGPGLVTIVEGLPRGLSVAMTDFSSELARRRQGYGRGDRMKIEVDELEVLGGIRHGLTLGSPVSVVVRNTEWPKWSKVMAIEPDEPVAKVTRPRPGHADLPGMLKYDTDDARDILERASARETAARTIAGVLAKLLLDSVGVRVVSHVTSIGSEFSRGPAPGPDQMDQVDASEVRCLDTEAEARMVTAIDQAKADKDTLGGTFEVIVYDVPAGVGSHTHYDRRLDGLLAAAVMSIPAIKAVGIGDGFESAARRGSVAHDEIYREGRRDNRAGGLEGGMSNGEPIRVTGAMKPISTLMQPLDTVDMSTGEPAKAVRERSDVCAVPAAAVVAEQMVAFVIAAEMLAQFGGDTVDDFRAGVERYRKRISDRL